MALVAATSFGLGSMSLPESVHSAIFGSSPTNQAQSQSDGSGGSPTGDSKKDLLYQTSHAFNDIVKKAMPAVVSISVVKVNQNPLAGLFPGGIPGGVPFGGGDENQMGDHQPGDRGGGGDSDSRSLGVGSGVIIRPDGFILTNQHVVEDGVKITVTIDEKHKRPAKVVGVDKKTDLAVLKLENYAADGKQVGPLHDLPSIQFGNSNQIKVGDWAVAIGSPFGLNRTVTSGIISAKGRNQMGILDVEDFIQTDAAINPGSSGGPLLNIQGQMIGVNTAIFSEGGGNVGIGFAIPSSIAKQVSDQIIAHGHVIRGWVGLSAQDLDPDLARYFRLPKAQQDPPPGALISDVSSNGPGRKATLQPGDVIVKFDQHPIESASQLKSLVGNTPIGKKVEVDFMRSGKAESNTMTIEEQPQPPDQGQLPQAQLAGQAGKRSPNFGLAVEDTPPEITRLLDMPRNSGAFIVGVEPGSPAFDSGIQPGDIVLKAGQTEIHGARQFRQVVKRLKGAEPTVFYVQRGPDERVFVAVKGLS